MPLFPVIDDDVLSLNEAAHAHHSVSQSRICKYREQ